MSDHDFISIGLPMGTARLTISATSVTSMQQFFNALNDVDENDPDGLSAISYILDGINTINAAVSLKMPQAAPVANSAPASSPSPTPAAPATAPGTPPLCETHNQPMKWEADGTVRTGQNAGRKFQAWKCAMPYTPGVRCGFKDFKYL